MVRIGLPRRFKFKLRFEKRERFAAATLFLSSGLILTQVVWTDFRFFAVFLFTILTYPIVGWAIREDIKGVELITLFVLPVLFSLSVSLFYFLLPVRWLTRLPTVIFFAIGMYAILLSENIFNVAANRSIQLLRAGRSVAFLITLVVLFLSINIIFSFHLPFYQNFLSVLIIGILLFFQYFWSVTLEDKISGRTLLYSIGSGLTIGELALSFSFWPIRTTIVALFISSVFYAVAGIVGEHFSERLFRGVVKEYLWVPIIVFVLTIVATRWS